MLTMILLFRICSVHSANLRFPQTYNFRTARESRFKRFELTMTEKEQNEKSKISGKDVDYNTFQFKNNQTKVEQMWQ